MDFFKNLDRFRGGELVLNDIGGRCNGNSNGAGSSPTFTFRSPSLLPNLF